MPISSRTLLKTPRDIQTTIVSGMEYYNFGVKNQLIANLETNYSDFSGSTIYLSMNIDGIPFYKSTKHTSWPVLLSCNIQPITVFPVIITYGKSKPTNNDFLNECIDEIKELMEYGLHIFNRKIKIILHSIPCDSPARSMVKCVKSHAGYYSCDRCTQSGERINGRMVFKEIGAVLRTNQSFRNKTNEEHHLYTADSPFLALNIDMIQQFPIDYMHCLCLGVMKHLLLIWLGKDRMFNSRRYRISSINTANKRLEIISKNIPKDIFSRRPRSLDFVKYWKATEYRQFLLYTGHIVLKDLIPECYYNNFLMLNAASLILLRPNSTQETVKYAKELFEYFIQVCNI